MSYLLQFVRHPTSTRARNVRVDEHTRLNHPGLYGDAFVRVFVEETSKGCGRDPHTELTIADCDEEITLEFSLETAQLRENSLFKIDTLLAALHRFRHALAAEAELRA
jgi:hypothetical protein